MPRTKKKVEAPTEPTIEEKIKAVLAHYGNFNRHVRRMWGKLVGLKIPPLIKPHIKGKYKPLPPIVKENAVCKNAKFVKQESGVEVNEGCKNLRANGSSRCSKCSEKHNGKK